MTYALSRRKERWERTDDDVISPQESTRESEKLTLTLREVGTSSTGKRRRGRVEQE